MTIKSKIGSNMTELTTDSLVVLVSYSTRVAYYDRNTLRVFVTEEHYSATTTKHVKKWLKSFHMFAKEICSQDTLDNLVLE